MRWIAPLCLLLSGCVAPRTGGGEEVERRIASLEEEVRALREENISIRRRLVDLEAVRDPLVGATPSPTSSIAARCTKDGDRYALTGAQVDEVFQNTAGLASEMRLIPAFENGHARGFKMFAIRSGSFVASCGFQNGDVLTHVNGREINSPDKALEAYSQAKNADRLEFAVERKGEKTLLVIAPRG